MLFTMVSCNRLNPNIIRRNLTNAGYTITSPKTDDMEILRDILPQKTIAAVNVLDSIAIFLYDSKEDAKKAKQTYTQAMGDMISMLKIGIKENAFYIATTDTIIEIAFENA